MVKTMYDYVPKIQEKFPYLSKEEIERILYKGFKTLHFLSRFRFHFHFRYEENNKQIRFYFGHIIEDRVASLKELQRKLLRLCYMRGEKPDGYYYVIVSEDKHKELLELGEEKTFKDVMFYKFKYLLKSALKNTHIWKIKNAPPKWKASLYVKEYKTTEAEYHGIRR